MERNRNSRVMATAAALSLLIAIVGAQFAFAESADEIMRAVDEQRGPGTSRSRMTMRIYGSLEADEHDRELRLEAYGRGTEDSLIEFVSPRSIAGLRVLDTGGTIRVFFPSTGRVRNIGGRARGGAVGGVGGDFSYEDMGGAGFIADYTDFAIEDEDEESWVISARPRDPDSRYSRLEFHVEREMYVATRIDYYENREPMKRLDAGRIEEIGEHNVATHLVMRNFAEDSRTEIRMHDLVWDLPLDDDLFHPHRFHR